MRALLIACAWVGSVSPAWATAPGDHRISMDHEGRHRSYIVHVPPQTTGALPVVISLHGGGGNAEGQQQHTRMDDLADREGFIVAYPDGTGRLKNRLLTWNAGTCCGYATREHVDDVGFIAAMLDDLAQRASIDASRVYATGMSNGAMMAYRLAAELPDRIAAIAPVAGGMVFADDAPKRPVPIMHIHSVDDPRALYAGGLGLPFPMTSSRVMHPAVEQTLATWRRVNQCKGDPRVAEKREGEGASRGQTATLLVYQGCKAALEHWRLTGAGHVWPGGKRDTMVRILGPGTQVIDANLEIWRFFSRSKP